MTPSLPNDYPRIASSGTLEEKARLWMTIVGQAGPAAGFEWLRQTYLGLFSGESLPVAWLPDAQTLESANITSLMKELNIGTFQELHRWSAAHRPSFWEAAIRRLGIVFGRPYDRILDLSGGVEDPRWLAGAAMNITDSCFCGDPSATALITGAEGSADLRRFSFAELKKSVNRVASALRELGFVPGDRLVIYAPLAYETIVTYLAIVRAGLVVVSVPDSYSAVELGKRIEVAKASGVVTCDGYLYNGKWLRILDKVREVTQGRGQEEVPSQERSFLRTASSVQSPDAATARLTTIICSFGDKQERREHEVYWEDLQGSEDFASFVAAPDDPTNILFSSGTTKEPKAIAFTHLTPVKCASDGYFHLDIQASDTVTWTTGMGWMMAPWLIYASLINKATLAVYTGAAAGLDFGRFVEQSGVTILGTIPSVVRAWRTQGYENKFNWNVRVYSSTGEPSNADDYFYLMSLTGFRAPIVEYCGGTEIGGGYITGTIVQPASPAVFTTPARGLDFYLLDEEHRPAEPGKAGEVFLVPPSIGMSQTLLNADHHQEYYEGVPRGPQGEPLRRHGDAFETVERMGTIFYRSVGRIDDAMNLGGVKVSALEIETVINKHPAVLDSAAFSVLEGVQRNERLVVYYTSGKTESEKQPSGSGQAAEASPGEEQPAAEQLKKELQQMINRELTPLFKLSELVHVDTLMRTASNKLMRRALKQQYRLKA